MLDTAILLLSYSTLCIQKKKLQDSLGVGEQKKIQSFFNL